jgi:hypothetical protein
MSYEEFSGERSPNEAAQRQVRERLNHVTAGFDREERDVKTGLGIVSNLGVIWTGAERSSSAGSSQNSCSPG